MNDKKIINAALWFFALCVGVILITSCSPYQLSQRYDNLTATPAATVELLLRTKNLTPTALPHCTVTAGALYLRSGASMARAALDVLHSGDVLRVIYSGTKWIQVETAQHVTGWVFGRWCK
jgi:uncharacterized protein YgiM (DUF1202 family)